MTGREIPFSRDFRTRLGNPEPWDATKFWLLWLGNTGKRIYVTTEQADAMVDGGCDLNDPPDEQDGLLVRNCPHGAIVGVPDGWEDTE